MKKLAPLFLIFSAHALAAGPVYLYDAEGNAILSTGGALNTNTTINLPYSAATGGAVPVQSAYVGASKAGILTGLLMGQQTMANSLACVLPSDQAAIPVTQSATWNINNISGTISLPSGAATSAKQPALGTAGSASADVITIQGIAGMTALKVDGSAITQPISAATLPLPTNAATETTLSSLSAKLPSALGQTTMAGSVSVAIASNQSAITTKLQDGSGTAITSSTIGSNVGLHTKHLGGTAVDKARIDYSLANVTTSAYTQLVGALAAEAQEVEIFDSSGQTLLLATGGAGSEADKVYIVQGGNGRIPLRIASGTRVAIKAVTATASSGEIIINFYGL